MKRINTSTVSVAIGLMARRPFSYNLIFYNNIRIFIASGRSEIVHLFKIRMTLSRKVAPPRMSRRNYRRGIECDPSDAGQWMHLYNLLYKGLKKYVSYDPSDAYYANLYLFLRWTRQKPGTQTRQKFSKIQLDHVHRSINVSHLYYSSTFLSFIYN